MHSLPPTSYKLKPVFGIIGAQGHMGKAFTKLFRKRGMKVIGSDMATKLRNEDVVRTADIIIFSVPISKTPVLIAKLASHAKKNALLCDLTSIKTPALQAFQKYAPKTCEILGLHPMFGPDGVEHLEQQIIAVCPLRKGPWAQWLLKFFESQGALLRSVTPEHHDNLMAFIQGIVHLSSIAMGMAFEKLQLNLSETLAFSSPIYRLRLDMVGRILHQDATLYGEIALENPATRKAMKAYLDSIATLFKRIERHDQKGFERDFDAAAGFLGNFNQQAYERTTALIQRNKNIP